jgi:hypothetical protein
MTYAMSTGGLFDGISHAFKSVAHGAESVAHGAKSAFHHVASFVRHPPTWFVVAMPLFTMENQRYIAKKIGGSTGAKIYDAGLGLVVSKALGPEGPKLLEAYNKIMDDAASGHVDARAILARAPEIAKLATASRQGAGALQSAILETESHIQAPGPVSIGGEDLWGTGPETMSGCAWCEASGSGAGALSGALIEAATQEVICRADPRGSSFVWRLDPQGGSEVISFGSCAEAIDFLRWWAHAPYVALAIFDREDPRWPAPSGWLQPGDPAHAPAIEHYVARSAPATWAGWGGGALVGW